MNRVVADANVILRFLTKVPAAQGQRAEKLFKDAETGKLEILVSPVVVGEAWAVLVHSLRKTALEASEGLSMTLRLRGVAAEDRDNVLAALDLSSHKVDFVDAYIAVYARAADLAVASFDRDLPRRLGARAHPL